MNDEERYLSRNLFLFGEPSGFFTIFGPRERADSLLYQPLLAFKANLNSAILVGNIPGHLSEVSVFDQRFGQILAAERIRTLALSLSEEERERMALAKARERMFSEYADPANTDRLARETLKRLDQHLSGNASFQPSAEELLRQLLVIGWGAFEILSNDILRIVLNERPSIVASLIEHKPYREALSVRRLIEALENSAFDLSCSMGDVFCEVVSLDSLEKIREAVHFVIGDSHLDAFLKDERLWRISQQRHLIVHRRGIVDARYRSRTGDNAAIGEHIKFRSGYIEASLMCVRDMGCCLFDGAQRLLSRTSNVSGSDASCSKSKASE